MAGRPGLRALSAAAGVTVAAGTGRALQIVVVRPKGFVYVESWREAIDALHFGLAELGITVPVRDNRIEAGAVPIIFGAHHLGEGEEYKLPPDSILFNLEQLQPGYPWFGDRYLRMLSRFRVWDFSRRNVEFLRTSGINRTATRVPVGYVPQLSRITAATEDVDVLFYGLVSPRRKAILDRLAGLGLKVVALDGVFGDERDQWIARSKVVLSIHLGERGMFESLRVVFLLANRKAVICEGGDDEIEDDIREGLLVCEYDRLVDETVALVRDPGRRSLLAEAGYRAITNTRHRMSSTLRAMLFGPEAGWDGPAGNAPVNDLERYFDRNPGRMIHKWRHYFEIYDRYFSRYRNKPVTIMEIGVYQGGSLQMWKAYFGARATIWGVDINPLCKQFEEERVHILIGDQGDRQFLASLARQLPAIDILIDDGGHTMRAQIATFEILFPKVAPDGVYICEDLHTSYWREYGGGLRDPASFVEFSKNYIDQLNAYNANDPQRLPVSDFTRTTYAMHYYDGIIVIEKRPHLAPMDVRTGERVLPDDVFLPPLP